MTSNGLTAVVVSYRKKRINNRILFGSPDLRIRRGWRRDLVVFAPGHIFGYQRWRGDKYGTQDWRLFICQAISSGPMTKIPGVIPGARLLVAAKGKARVKRGLSGISAMERRFGSAEKVPFDRWRRLHNAIENGAHDVEDV